MDLSVIIAFVASLPYVGPFVAPALTIVLGASAVVTALFALWHAFVGVLLALSLIPGLSGLAAFANQLKTLEDSTEGFFAGKIKPILDRLSLIPIPKKKE